MKYQKARVRIVNFGSVSFMLASNTPAAQAAAEEAASDAAIKAYGGNAKVSSISSSYDQAEQCWIVELTVTNNGGNKPKRYMYKNGVLTELD